MRVADLDELCKEMKEVFEEVEVSDDFKKGFSYAMNIVQRKRGIKIHRWEDIKVKGRPLVATSETRELS